MVEREPVAHTKQVFVVLNPVAGNLHAPELREALRHHFADDAWTYQIYETTGSEDIGKIVREACHEGAALVIAAGGDGTVADVANALVGIDIPLGVLPFGTGNLLSRALNIPPDLHEALHLLTNEHSLQSLDVLKVGDRHFLLNVSAGMSARTMRDTSSERKRRLGMVAYIWTVIRKLSMLRPVRFRLLLDGRRIEVGASEVLVTNGALFSTPDFPLGPRESYNDGELDVFALTARRLSEYLRLGWRLLRKQQPATRGLRHFRVREHLRIETAGRSQPVQGDGEIIGRTPLELQVVRSALRVVVPRKQSE